MTALEIDLQDIDFDQIREPTKGKEVTQEEFRAIMHEKMKEMRNGQGDGRMRIIHRGN